MYFKYFFLFLYSLDVNFIKSLNYNEDLFIKITDENDITVKKDLMEYIEDGKILMDKSSSSKIKKNVIMVLGLTGTGKTTLVNHLSGVPLICVKIEGEWRVDLAPNAIPLPGGFKIGHKTKSETIFPAVYSPPNKDFSYVDNPGFQDNRGLAIEIANNFFREHATKTVDNMKFLILLTYQDLQLRATQCRDTIKRFSEILGIFDDNENIKTLSKSIGLVITRVDDHDKTNDEIKEIVFNKLNECLSSEKEAGNLSTNEEIVFEDIISNNQIEIVSSCKSKRKIDDKQKNNVIELVNNLNYFEKTIANFRPGIDPKYAPKLDKYINERNEIFKNEFRIKFEKSLDDYVTSELYNIETVEDLNELIQNIRDIILKYSHLMDFNSFLDILDEILMDTNSQLKFKEKKELLNFFGRLLPTLMQNNIFSEKNHLNDFKLESIFNNKIDFLNEMRTIRTEFKINNGVLTIKGCFLKSSEIESYYTSRVKNIVLNLCQTIYFDKNLSLPGIKSLTIIAPRWFVNNVDINQKIKQIKQEKFHKLFISGLSDKTDEDTLKTYFSKYGELVDYVVMKDKETNKSLGFGFVTYSSSSMIDELMRNRPHIIDDKQIEIKRAKLKKNSIKKHNIHTAHDGKVEIDLSGTEAQNHTLQAFHGLVLGSSGNDGAPGSMGENSGMFYGFGNQFTNLNNLVLKVNGGRGGNGQNGGNGIQAEDGKHCFIPDGSQTEISYDDLKKKFIDWGGWEIAIFPISMFNSKKIRKYFFQSYGNMPPPGGNGGRGGKGGKGGLLGSVFIYKLDEKLNEYFKNVRIEHGKNGQDGIDGDAGKGASSGCRYYCTRSRTDKEWGLGKLDPFSGSSETWEEDLVNICQSKGTHGISPTDKNTIGLLNPTKSNDIIQNLEILLLEYKIDQIKNKFSILNPSFFNSLDKVIIENETLDKIVDLRINELKILDLNFYKYSKIVDFKPIYQSLIYKLIRSNDLIKDKPSNNLHINVLNFLTAYGFSRINELDDLNNNIVITNLNDYIKIMIKNFEILQSFKSDELKYLYKKDYTQFIGAKINEANEFLNHLQESIKTEYTSVNLYVNQLESEVQNVIVTTQNEIQSLNDKKDELIKAKKKKFFFGILSIAIQAVSMIYLPYGPVISNVLMTGLNFAQEPNLESFINFGDSAYKFNDQLKEITQNAKLDQNSNSNNKIFIEKIKSIAKDLEPVLKAARSIYADNKQHGDEINQIDRQIEELNNQIKQLESFKNQVPNNLALFMNELIFNVQEYQLNMNKKSSVSLIYFYDKELKKFFKDSLTIIEATIGSFDKSTKNFKSIIDNLKECLQISMSIYKKVNEYRDHMIFTDYLSKMQVNSAISINYGKYQADVNSLKSSIQFNIVHEMYIKTIKTIGQWMFPFASNILVDLTPIDYQIDTSLNDKLIINMKENLIKIEHRVERYYSSIEKIDEAIMKMKFSIYQPFYKWTCDRHEENIKRLLAGEKVIFKTDIKKTLKNAVKFNRIDIKLRSTKQLENNLIKLIEENYKVTLRHGGESYFKYKNLYYIASNDKPFSITFSFKKDSNGLPIVRNEAYDKMMNGIYLLSPYTSWIIQLEPIDDSMSIKTLSNLDEIITSNRCDIQISLIGEGSYVNEKLIQKELNLNLYYTLYD